MEKSSAAAGIVPDAAVVGGGHAEAVVAGAEIVVKGLAAAAGILPFGIVALQFVAEAAFFRRHETERGIVDLQIADQRRQAQGALQIGCRKARFSVDRDLFDLHGWWESVDRQVGADR